MNTVSVKIITARNDGCTVMIEEQPDNALMVRMVSNNGTVVIEELIQKAELFDWLDEKQDW